jgi:glycosyltransferase involved in cell wall biosynthesis
MHASPCSRAICGRRAKIWIAGRHENTAWPGMAKALGVADRVHFLGFCTDMPALMRAADFFVFPSRYEACSLVLLEALASGLPVITAASAGGAEIVAEGCGFVLPECEDVDLLSRLMAMLADDAPLRQSMRQAARKIALTHGWQAMARRYLALLEAAHHA